MANNIIQKEPESIIEHNEDTLSRIVGKALQQIEDILDMEVPEDRKAAVKLLSVKKDAAAAIINAGLKADENRFRRENKDIIERLFAKLNKDGKIVEGKVVK